MASSTASSSTSIGVVAASPALAMMLTSRHRLVAESGRDSSMRTVSPTCASLASSWALNLLVKRITRLYSGCRVMRSTDTTIVLSILSLTSVRPWSSACPSLLLLPSRDLLSPAGGLGRRPRAHVAALTLHGKDPRDRVSGLGNRAVVLQLPGGELEACLPEILLGLAELLVKLSVGQGPNLINVHLRGLP